VALALTKTIAKRNRNVSLQNCYLGLAFAGTPMGARLAAADYIAVQTPENLQRVWYWVYEPRTGLIVSRADSTALISTIMLSSASAVSKVIETMRGHFKNHARPVSDVKADIEPCTLTFR
jgi:hypothetical protein